MLDKKDILILKELQKKSNQQSSTLSSKLNIPRSTINTRKKKMEEMGIIKSYTVQLDYAKLGYPVTVFLLVSFESGQHNSDKKEVTQHKLVERIASLDQVYEAHIITGEHDILVKIRGKSLEEIGHLVVEKIRLMKGVGKSYTLASYYMIKEKV
jgi:Lrp/AsnC family leucine-responsive transcriptional regulator